MSKLRFPVNWASTSGGKTERASSELGQILVATLFLVFPQADFCQVALSPEPRKNPNPDVCWPPEGAGRMCFSLM